MNPARLLMRVTSLLFLCLSVFVLMHSAQQNRTFTVAGHSAEIPVTEMGGRSYVEIEALARLANGSLGFRGNQIVLTLPPSNANTSTTAAPGFKMEFLRAELDLMTEFWEWRSDVISIGTRGI